MKEFILTINGKTYPCVEYSDAMGKLELPEYAAEILQGKPMEEQVTHYSITESRHIYKTFYGDEGNDSRQSFGTPILEYSDVLQLIIHNGMLVGAMIQGYYGVRPLLPGRSVCTYDISETDGSGTIERTDYASLLFKP